MLRLHSFVIKEVRTETQQGREGKAEAMEGATSSGQLAQPAYRTWAPLLLLR